MPASTIIPTPLSLQTPSGLTALHLAASEGHAGAVQVLLEFGAPVNMMDETEERSC